MPVKQPTPAVPRALGRISSITQQLVTVQFPDLEANPETVRGRTRQFKFDIGAGDFAIGEWVVASWGRSVRTDRATGAMLIQGNNPGGVYVRPLHRATNERHLETWLKQSQEQLKKRKIGETRKEQGTPPDPDSTPILQFKFEADLDRDPNQIAARAQEDRSWLPSPVPLAGIDKEWLYPPGYIRIGYVRFTVDSPATEIQVQELSPAESVSTIRSRTPIQKGNWHATQQVTIRLTLHGQDAINEILLPLARLFRRAPFQPVFNTLLFEHNITALTLRNIQVDTLPGFPNAFQVAITCFDFNWEAYCPAHEFTGLDELFCYPLLKLWIEEPLKDIPRAEPVQHRWDGKFELYHPAESWLREARELAGAGIRSERVNGDLDAAVRAVTLKGQPLDTGRKVPEGFRSRDKTTFLELGERFELAGNIGRALAFLGGPDPQPRDLIFFRPRTLEAAQHLAQTPDLVSIMLGPVQLIRLADRGSTTYRIVRDNESFANHILQSLRANHQPTIAAIEAGSYTFIIHAQASVWNTIQKMHRLKGPTEKQRRFIEQPVVDELNTFLPEGMVIEQISASMENIIAPLQLRGKRTATHQYLGSNAIYFQLVGTVQNESDRFQIEQFFTRVNELAREFRGRLDGTPFGGFCIVENELFHLLGARYVIPLSYRIDTIPDFPGAGKVTMTLVEFDLTQRRKETIQDLYRNLLQSAPSLATAAVSDGIKDRYLRAKDQNNRLRLAELYPDLSLPLHSKLARWVHDIQTDNVWDFKEDRPKKGYEYLAPINGGTGWEWSASPIEPSLQGEIEELPAPFLSLKPPAIKPDRFADPDFYCAPSNRWGEEFVEGIINRSRSLQMTLSDEYGTVASLQSGRRLDQSPVTQDPQNTIVAAQQAVARQGHPKPLGGSFSLVDNAQYGKVHLPGENQIREPGIGSTAAGGTYRIPQPDAAGKLSAVVPFDGGTVKDRVARYGPIAAAAAEQYQLPPDLLFALIETESNWRAGASSGKAMGLGQLTPATARSLGVTDIHDPSQNIYAAARYLKTLLNLYRNRSEDEQVRLALAGYNAGPGAVRKHGGVPPFAETQQYITKVLSRRQNYAKDGATLHIADRVNTPIRQEAKQLQRKFAQGYGFRKADLDPYIVGGATPSVVETVPFRDLTGTISQIPVIRQAESARRTFIFKEWLVQVTNTGSEIFYTISTGNLDAYVAATWRYKVTIPVVKLTERLPGKAFYENGIPVADYQPPTLNQAFYDPDTKRDVFHDMRREVAQGRLLGAFPTFYVAIVDGGRYLRVWRLFDHVYGMMAITRINVHRTRRGPVETAVVGFSNMYGHLTAQANEVARQQADDTRGFWTLEAMRVGWDGLFKYDEETIAMWARHLDSLLLKPGARLHIRLGYGSAADELPVVFNGTITEVPINEGEVQVTALSDGLELTNDLAPTNLQGSMPVTRLNAAMGSGIHPRELVMSYMAPFGFKEAIGGFLGSTVGNAFYYNYRNDYGIEHFGAPIRIGIGQDDGEIGLNVYSANRSEPYNQSNGWDNYLTIFQPNRWTQNSGLIGINMANATPWDIFETTRKTIPDYILYPMPFEFRSTLFMGRGWFPVFTGYRDDIDVSRLAGSDLDREVAFEWKPFQQLHLISSDLNLLDNNVRADAEGVATKCQAIGTYNGWKPGDGDLSNETSFVMMVDSDIYDEFQKQKNHETGLYTTVAMKLQDATNQTGATIRTVLGVLGVVLGVAITVGTGGLGGGLGVAVGAAGAGLFILGVGALAEGPIRAFFQSRRVMDTWAAMQLKDYVKEMYQGPLTVFGSGYLKPYDFVAIADGMSGLNGIAEARDVTHTMSLETGFVTQVTPDCVSHFVDFEARDLYLWMMNTASHLLTALALVQATTALARRASIGVVLRGVRALQRDLQQRIRRFRSTGDRALLGGHSLDDAVAAEKQIGVKIRELAQSVRSRSPEKVVAVLDDLVTNARTKPFFDLAPQAAKLEIQLQRGIRKLPGRAALDWARRGVGSIGSKIEERFLAAAVAVDTRAAKASREIARLQGEITQGGHTAADISRVEAAIARSSVTKSDRPLAALLKQVQRNRANLSRFALAARAAGQISGAGTRVGAAAVQAGQHLNLIRNVVRGSVSSTAIGGALLAVANIGLGCFSDWVVRSLMARQCLNIFPLRIYSKELSAGINGHRGSVAGDQLGTFDTFIQRTKEFFTQGSTAAGIVGSLLPVVSEVVTSNVNYRSPEQVPLFLQDEQAGN